MAINGAPLIRARYQDYELLMARRREKAAERIEQEPIDEAKQALEALRTVDPQADRDPAVARVAAAVYEKEVTDRLRHFFPETEQLGGPGDRGADALVRTSNGVIAVEVKAGKRQMTTGELRDFLLRSALAPGDAVLLVTNRALPTNFERRIRELRIARPELRIARPVSAVRWLDEQDDDALRAKVRSLDIALGSR
jgi:hypothetical protein